MEQGNNFEEFEKNEKETKIKSWISEIVLSIALIVFTILSLSRIPGTAALLIITAAILSCLYFYFSFAMLNGVKLKNIFKKTSFKGTSSLRLIATVGVGLNISIVILALLFNLMMWPGAKAMSSVAIIGLGIALIISFIKYFISKSNFYINILKRVIPYFILTIVLTFLPKHFILEYKYKNYDAYIEAEKALDEDPNNEVLQKKARDERNKIFEEESE